MFSLVNGDELSMSAHSTFYHVKGMDSTETWCLLNDIINYE